MTPSREPVRLRTALAPIGHHQALLDGEVRIPGVELDVQHVHPHPEIFRRMGHDDAFDLCELSVMTYLIGRDLGRPWSAIPVVPRHRFHHGDFVVNVDAGIAGPHDLVGRRVATRNWTVTPGVQCRGILSDEFGVDLGSITWVLSEGEHIPASADRHPPHVERAAWSDHREKLESGELAAGIAGSLPPGARSPRLAPLFPDAADLDARQHARTGVVPPFTVIVVHDRVVQGRPWLLEALYDAFVQARARGLEPHPEVAAIVPDDPVPVGLDANRPGLEELARLGHEQGMLTQTLQLDDLFAPLG